MRSRVHSEFPRGSELLYYLSGSLEGAGGIGGLLARTDHSLPRQSEAAAGQLSTCFYHCDAVGNVTTLLDGAQQIAARYLYDPFGNILSQAGPLAEENLYRFSSKEFHPQSGLVYYLYRHYEPTLQRWVNRDPLASQVPQKSRLWGLKLHIENEQAPNLYWPFGSDPANNYDPDGQFIPVPVLVCVVVAGLSVCGCSKVPPPPPNDPDDCWKNSNKYKVPAIGAGKQGACLARKTGCILCCEDKHPIQGGDPQKFGECMAGCEDNYKRCAALDTTTQR